MDLVVPLTPGLHAIALWDEAWQCYINMYLLRRGARLLLIDCGKAEQGDQLVRALAGLGVTPADVTDLVATHRHADHVGNAALLGGARRWIHPLDRVAGFVPELPGELGLVWRHLGFHTPGSVAAFDAESGAVFAGDHICFPSLPLGPEGLVSGVAAERALAYIRDWAGSEGARQRYRMELFEAGLQALAAFPARFLCTGHGMVVEGEVGALLRAVR